jgi:hypothetical protein
VSFEIGSCFMMSRWTWSSFLLSMFCHISWDDRHTPPCPAIGGDGSLTNSTPSLALNHNPQISASQVARIIGFLPFLHGSPIISHHISPFCFWTTILVSK